MQRMRHLVTTLAARGRQRLFGNPRIIMNAVALSAGGLTSASRMRWLERLVTTLAHIDPLGRDLGRLVAHVEMVT
jgi:hypothetical protein